MPVKDESEWKEEKRREGRKERERENRCRQID